MWPNPQETADLTHLLKKSLIKNFIFRAVLVSIENCLVSLMFTLNVLFTAKLGSTSEI